MSTSGMHHKGNKRLSSHLLTDSSPPKKPKLLLDDPSSDEDAPPTSGGAKVTLKGTDGVHDGHFQINEEYARRFEHNKRREELDKRV